MCNTLASLLLHLLLFASLVSAQTDVPAGTSCTKPRIRRPWEAYTSDEKTLYIEAVRKAITLGHHQKFVELHTEWFSEREAHGTCMFVYWHRMFLLGYENMLRSLGPDYECVTIPYWDHLSATARRASRQCTYMEGCSPLYQDFGGSQVGLPKSNVVYNISISRGVGAYCVNQAMLANFCGNSTPCANCLVRGTAWKTPYPAEAYFGSVYQQVFTATSWSSFALNIERGVHNTVHSALSGAMSYLQSPIDPVFYTHHGFIDLLQTIYIKCQLGSETATIPSDQKGTDPRWWTNCGRRTGGAYTKDDPITMKTRAFDKQWVHVRTNPNNTLYAFFKDLPAKFSDYVDAKDLGVYSYTYMLQGALTNMYINCDKSNTIDAATVSLLAEEDPDGDDDDSVLKPIKQPPTKFDNKMRRWIIAIYESARLAGYTEEAARDQMEMILCVHKQKCLGGVDDYNAIFRANFGATGHPRCFTILQQLASGDRVIGIPKWNQITDKFFPCESKVDAEPKVAATALEL